MTQMKKLLNLRPILIIALTFVLGIVCSYFYQGQKQAKLLAFAITFGVFLTVYLAWGTNRQTIIKKLCFCLVLLTAFTSGAYLLDRQISRYERADLGGEFCTIEGTVNDMWETEQGVCLSLNKVQFSGKIKGESLYGIFPYA